MDCNQQGSLHTVVVIPRRPFCCTCSHTFSMQPTVSTSHCCHCSTSSPYWTQQSTTYCQLDCNKILAQLDNVIFEGKISGRAQWRFVVMPHCQGCGSTCWCQVFPLCCLHGGAGIISRQPRIVCSILCGKQPDSRHSAGADGHMGAAGLQHHQSHNVDESNQTEVECKTHFILEACGKPSDRQ